MDDKVVCKVMLNSYRGLEYRCGQIDKAIYNTAIRSAFKNTMKTYKEIEQLTAEKIAYINAKVIIDKALSKLTKKYEIVQHHIQGASIGDIATALGETENTIERRAYRQREKLYDEILKEYSGEELLDIICDSAWLMNRYKREVNQSDKNKPKTSDKH